MQAGTIISTFFALVILGGCYFLGGFGRLFEDPSTFIAQLMGISWGLWPERSWRCSSTGCAGMGWPAPPCGRASFICGVGITVLNMFLHFIQSPINAGAAVMTAGLVIVPVVSLLTPVFDKKKVEEIFTCYDETVSVCKKTLVSLNYR